MSRAGHLT